MTEFSDMMLVLLMMAAYVFHQGGVAGAWEHMTGKFSELCEQAWLDIEAKLRGKE